MKCGSCGNRLTEAEGVNFSYCPFCGAAITAVSKPSDRTASVIRKIIGRYGENILWDRKRFIPLLMDFAPELKTEIKSIKHIYEGSVCGHLKKAYESDGGERETEFRIFLKKLSEEALLADFAVDILKNCFCDLMELELPGNTKPDKIPETTDGADTALKCRELGNIYYRGDGVEQSYINAVRLYKLAAELGDNTACNILGNCCYRGKGTETDYDEAVKWYRKAAEEGYAKAQCNLGTCFFRGKGVQRDKVEAVRWYKRAAEQGYSEGQRILGDCFYNGEGVGKDYEKAVKWYAAAAENGDISSQCRLGNWYYYGIALRQDYEMAAYYYCRAAGQGNRYAREKLRNNYRFKNNRWIRTVTAKEE